MTESPVRSILEGSNYVSLAGLAEARQHADACLIMEGDYGGTIYLTSPISIVECDEPTLCQLLLELDDMYWGDPDGAQICFELRPVGSAVAGGMGGGVVQSGIWMHANLEELRIGKEIEEVLRGTRARFDAAGRKISRKVKRLPLP